MFERDKSKGSAESFDFDGLIAEASGGKPRREVDDFDFEGNMPNDIGREIRVKIEESRRSERARRQQRGVHSQQEMFRDVLKRGVQVAELHPYASENARRFLAGFVISASKKGIPTRRSGNPSDYAGPTGLSGLGVRGWTLNIANYRTVFYGDNVTRSQKALITPGFKVYAENVVNKVSRIDESVVRENVVNWLTAQGAEWVEPDPAIYENR